MLKSKVNLTRSDSKGQPEFEQGEYKNSIVLVSVERLDQHS